VYCGENKGYRIIMPARGRGLGFSFSGKDVGRTQRRFEPDNGPGVLYIEFYDKTSQRKNITVYGFVETL
jgi:hypothetical protein